MRRYGIGSAAPPAKKAASPAKAKAAAKAASPAKAAPAAKAPPAPTAAAAAYDDDYVDVKDDDNDSDFDDDSDDELPLRVPTGAEAPGRSGTPVYSSLVASEVPRIEAMRWATSTTTSSTRRRRRRRRRRWARGRRCSSGVRGRLSLRNVYGLALDHCCGEPLPLNGEA